LNATVNANTPAFQARLRALSEELRCLVCQNQSLADSNAELAVDLKREVERLMMEGKSNAQIKSHLVERYGDFVLYKPPIQTNTAVLWAGPPALLVIGGLLWRLAQRKSKLNAAGPLDGRADQTAKKLLD
jgi:cytochrome c-type biogenesis protein CcmH